MTTPSHKQVADALHTFYAARDNVRDCKVECMRIAVELGMPQQDAKEHAIQWLDGLLAGQGHLPEGRRNAD